MEVVDQSGQHRAINTVVYKSMKDKLGKYDTVLSNLMAEIKDSQALVPSPEPSPQPSFDRSISPIHQDREGALLPVR
jgi:hypothetical protein